MIPNGWRKVAIEDIAKVIRGSSPRPKGDPRYYGGTVPRLMGADVTRDGKYVTPNIDFLTDEGAKLSRPVPAGTMTVVCSGDVGVPSFLAVDACIHDGFLGLLDITDDCDKDFLFCVLSSLTGRLERSATHGGVFTNLTTTILKEFTLNLPPLPEQQKIAAILSTWDRAIKLIEKLIAAQQKRKQALMQQLLTGKVRLPGFTDSVWKSCHLGDVAKNSTRRNGSSNTDQATVYSVTNSVGMIPMDEGVIGESIERYKTVSRFNFAYNPMRINVGSIAMWSGDEDVLVSPDYVVFQCGPKLNAEYLEHFRKTHYWSHFVTRAGGGSVRVRIYFSDLSAMKLNLPSIDEQKAIASVLNAQDEEVRLLGLRLNALKKQKKGLMQQLLTGNVRVNVDAETVKG